MSRHGPHAASGSGVAIGFDVATQFGQGWENLCRDREFSVVMELATTGSSVAHDRAGRSKASAHDSAHDRCLALDRAHDRPDRDYVATDLFSSKKKKTPRTWCVTP